MSRAEDTGKKAKAGVWDTAAGKIKTNSPHNIRLALTKMNIELKFDDLASRVLINGEMITGDEVLTDLRVRVADKFEFLPGKELFYDVVGETARQKRFHPIKDYLDALVWDGEERIGDWLHLYLGASDDPYTRAVGRIWLVAAVRRVRHPGCVFQEMLVLEGAQGTEKSTAFKMLAVEDDWFSDDLPFNADSKKFIEQCGGRWVIEFSELAGINKRDVEHVKATLSRTIDSSRLAYGRETKNQKRTCVFAGTTNDAEYLRDMTGGRRFWPVRTGVIDTEALERDRDQLWAEAAAAEEAGESIRLSENLWDAAAVEQERRRAPHPWEESLAAILAAVNEGVPVKVRTTDVWLAVGMADVGRRTQEHNVNLGKVMKKLGFERTTAAFGGKIERAYKKQGGEGNMVIVKWFKPRSDRDEDGRWRASTGVSETQDEIPF